MISGSFNILSLPRASHPSHPACRHYWPPKAVSFSRTKKRTSGSIPPGIQRRRPRLGSHADSRWRYTLHAAHVLPHRGLPSALPVIVDTFDGQEFKSPSPSNHLRDLEYLASDHIWSVFSDSGCAEKNLKFKATRGPFRQCPAISARMAPTGSDNHRHVTLWESGSEFHLFRQVLIDCCAFGMLLDCRSRRFERS